MYPPVAFLLEGSCTMVFSIRYHRLTRGHLFTREGRHQRDRRARPVLEALEDRFVPSFLPPVTYQTSPPASSSPYTVATGDFRGSGVLDLAVVNPNFHNVSVLMGNGDGTFQNAVTYPVDPLSDLFIALGDVNGDGHLDIVTVGSNVSVLLGNGNGTFQSAITTHLNSTISRLQGIALGDLTGTGHLDIVTASEGIGVLRGNGDGTFRLPYFLSGGHDDPRGIVLGDLRGTGILDLATVSFFTVCDPEGGTCSDYGSVNVRFGTGDGFFVPGGHYDIGGAASTIAIGDFNGDGNLDLLTGNGYSMFHLSSVSVLLGNGDGTFQRPIYSPLPGGPATSLVVADFNGDGILDVAAAHPFSNTVTVSLGNGDGTFGDPLSVAVDRYPYTLATGDFNGDGFPDLVSADLGTGTVSVLLNDTSWGTAPGGANGAHRRHDVAANAFREAGLLDVASTARLRPGSVDLSATAFSSAELPAVEPSQRPLTNVKTAFPDQCPWRSPGWGFPPTVGGSEIGGGGSVLFRRRTLGASVPRGSSG
jgi:hypothetical protein